MSEHLPEGQYVELDDTMRVHYLDFPATGPITRSSTLVMVHGSGPGASGWSNFKQNVAAFNAAGYRVVVYDQPGYGYTSKPTDAVYTLDYFSGYLLGLLDHLQIERCVPVGNSLGGAVAMGLALTNPERVEALILMAPGGLEEKERYFQTEGIQAMVKYPMGSPEFTREVLESLLGLLVHDNAHVTPELVAERWHILQQQNPQVLITMQVPNLTHRLGELKVPVLGFWGTNDKFCPVSGAEHLYNCCEDALVHVTTQCGHWVMVEHTDYFNRQCIDFLEHRCGR